MHDTFGSWLEAQLNNSANPTQRRKKLAQHLNKESGQVLISQWIRTSQMPRERNLRIVMKFFNISSEEESALKELWKKQTSLAITPNPTRPITAPHQFFGRQELLKEFEQDWTKTSPIHVMLAGKKQSGKTSFLYYLRNTQRPNPTTREHQKHPTFPKAYWSYIDFRVQKPLHYLLKGVIKDFNRSLEKADLGLFYDISVQRLDKPAFILLDHVEEGLRHYDADFWGALCALAQSDQPVGFCATTRYNMFDLITLADQYSNAETSSFLSRFEYRYLDALSEPEARDLLSHYANPTLSDDEMHWVLTESYRYPAVLQSMCYTRQRLAAYRKDWQTFWLDQEAPRFEALLNQLTTSQTPGAIL